MSTIAGARVRAPELSGAGGWINTDRPLTLAALRGRVVVLDFWTFCCINCLRVIEELRPLERRFGERLIVIGVHSPKFPHEQDHEAVERAVRRHRIEHPVLDDPDMRTWQEYGVRAWPTLVVIDPAGYVVASTAGEGHGEAIGALVERLLAGADADGTLPPFIKPPEVATGTLAFPGKVASDGGSRLAIADTGHDRVIVCALDGKVIDIFGGFAQPQGVRFDGGRLLVCSTVAGELVAVDLEDRSRRTLAGGLRSPWDVVRLRDGTLVVAEAGTHRLLRVPAEGGAAEPLAGTGAEGLRDGPAAEAHLAQPSGLTVLPDGALAFADSEVSALRVLRDGRIETLVGEGLFDWGDRDGSAGIARLQHPLGVAALPDGAIAIADTFNSRVRIWRDGTLSTVAVDSELGEPGGLDVLPDGRLILADTNNHRVVAVDAATGAITAVRVEDPPAEALTGSAGATLSLPIRLDLGGQDLDTREANPVRVHIRAVPEALLAGGNRSLQLERIPETVEVRLGEPGTGALTVDAIASTCTDELCSISRQTRQYALSVT